MRMIDLMCFLRSFDNILQYNNMLICNIQALFFTGNFRALLDEILLRLAHLATDSGFITVPDQGIQEICILLF